MYEKLRYSSYYAFQLGGTVLTFVLRLVDAELGLGDSAHDKLSFDPETDAEEDVSGDLWWFTS